MNNIFRNITFSRLAAWIRKGSYSVIDQGLFSGTNFILNIFLARWLAPSSYGAFSIAFATYLFFTGFYNALVLEPMSVLGTANHTKHLKSYISIQFQIHMLITVPAGVLMAFIGLYVYYYSRELGEAIISAGFALPFMLILWLSRRAFYVLQNPSGALIGSFTYFVLLVIGMFVVRQIGSSRQSDWYILMAISSFLAVATSMSIAKFKFDFCQLNFITIIKEQWEFSKWIVIAAILNFVGLQAYLIIVASILGIDMAGVFRAMQNFSLPVNQFIFAISVLALPVLSAEFGRLNFLTVKQKGLSFTAILFVGALIYELFLFLFYKRLELILYDGKFAGYSILIPLFGLTTMITAAEVGLSLIVRSVQRSEYHAIFGLIGAIAVLMLTPVMTSVWGIQGAVFSQIFVSFLVFLGTLVMYFLWFPRDK